MSIRMTRELTFGDVTVTVKELTVAEVRAWLSRPEKSDDEKKFDSFVDLPYLDGVSVSDLMQFSDLTSETIELLPMSALQKIALIVKELNSVFFSQYVPKVNNLLELLKQESAT